MLVGGHPEGCPYTTVATRRDVLLRVRGGKSELVSIHGAMMLVGGHPEGCPYTTVATVV
jgi:ribosome modulation factor